MDTILDAAIGTEEKLTLLALSVLHLTNHPEAAQPFPSTDEEVAAVTKTIMGIAIQRMTDLGYKITASRQAGF